MVAKKGSKVRVRVTHKGGIVEEVEAHSLGVSFGGYPLRWFFLHELEILPEEPWHPITGVER